MILSILAGGMSAPRSGKFGFFSSTNCRFGTDSVTMYAPTPGGGSSVISLQGVSPGTGAANHMPSTWENEPSGSVRLIVMSPVLSSVTMPLMSPSHLPAST